MCVWAQPAVLLSLMINKGTGKNLAWRTFVLPLYAIVNLKPAAFFIYLAMVIL
jgi:hypothetical protein